MRIHRRISLLFAALVILNVSSCASNSSTSTSTPSANDSKASVQSPETEDVTRAEEPVVIEEVTQAEEPVEAEDVTQAKEPVEAEEGTASWYGPGFYGKKTTSGDVLQKGTMTAAHSSLPIGTEVKVTRLDTNESVTVEINDRSPHKEGRLIDLAHGAAEALDIDDDGIAEVRIEVLD